MKLAEALIERVELQRKNSELVDEIMDNVHLPDCDEPTIVPEELIRRYDANMTRLNELVRRINKTNCFTEMSNGRTLVDAIAKRDCLISRIAEYSYSCFLLAPFLLRSEKKEKVKYVRHADLKTLKRKLSHLSQELRKLDTAIQAKNRSVELLE
jgi:hypothetical protein